MKHKYLLLITVLFSAIMVKAQLTLNTISGRIITPNGAPDSNIAVNYTGDSRGTIFTDMNNHYSINLHNGNYTVRPYRNIDSIPSGITSLDVALVQAHILGKNKLNSPYKMIAADVNGDGKIIFSQTDGLEHLLLSGRQADRARLPQVS